MLQILSPFRIHIKTHYTKINKLQTTTIKNLSGESEAIILFINSVFFSIQMLSALGQFLYFSRADILCCSESTGYLRIVFLTLLPMAGFPPIGQYRKKAMHIYIFGNGNISFTDYRTHYEQVLLPYLNRDDVHFLVCDFKGVDTLTMELLKCCTERVSVYHIAERPRYMPDRFRTKVNGWKVLGGFENDEQRDLAAIRECTHFIAVDFNSDNQRKSGTLQNMERCERAGKIRLSI